MANATAFYLKDIMKKSAGYRPTWEPNKPLKIGDVGKLENNVFVKWDSLEKLGIPMEVEKDVQEGALFDLSTENGIEVRTKAKGQVDPGIPSLGEMDAGFGVEFKKENAILFKVQGYLTHQISNLGEIAREVLKRYENDEWDKDLVIINELIEAKKATIMMSSEGGVSVGLKAKADVSAANLSIADADLDVGTDVGGKLAINIIGEEGITPLYRAVGIKKKWLGLGKAEIKTRIFRADGQEAAGEPESMEEDLFEEVEMTDDTE